MHEECKTDSKSRDPEAVGSQQAAIPAAIVEGDVDLAAVLRELEEQRELVDELTAKVANMEGELAAKEAPNQSQKGNQKQERRAQRELSRSKDKLAKALAQEEEAQHELELQRAEISRQADEIKELNRDLAWHKGFVSIMHCREVAKCAAELGHRLRAALGHNFEAFCNFRRDANELAHRFPASKERFRQDVHRLRGKYARAKQALHAVNNMFFTQLQQQRLTEEEEEEEEE